MRKISQFLYVYLLKPILFLFPADGVHNFFLRIGRFLGEYKIARKVLEMSWAFGDKILEQDICDLHFKNPIGLSAGFDYNADLVKILPSIGFGFHTIGTLTHESYQGNPAPMLRRLPKSRSLLVNKGFKNEGVDRVLKSFGKNTSVSPRGVSIGATNKVYKDFDDMVSDIVLGFKDAQIYDNFDYYELNISCPNLINTLNLKEQLASPSGFMRALESLAVLNIKRPVFVKMPLERDLPEIEDLMEIANKFLFVKGLIFSNLAKDRNNKVFDPEEIKSMGAGNFSGKPLEDKSNEILGYTYKKYGHRFILVGVGGVFDAKDAYKKILLGASLVQLITGMIFMGPQQIGTINKELSAMLKKDGFKNIKDAVGAIGKV